MAGMPTFGLRAGCRVIVVIVLGIGFDLVACHALIIRRACLSRSEKDIGKRNGVFRVEVASYEYPM